MLGTAPNYNGCSTPFCADIFDPGFLYNKYVSSIVCVEFRPHQLRLYQRLEHVSPIPLGQAHDGDRWRGMDESERNVSCTGFIVEPQVEDPLNTYVLTCTSVLGSVFSPNHPITPAQIGQLYQPYIICDHRERTFREGQEPDGVRHFTRAYPHLVSLVNDLLLLRIPTNSMQDYCARPHPPLEVANRFPKPLKKVVMVSLPGLNLNRTAVTGETSHRGRDFADLATRNPFGFTTRLSEVRIPADGQSSSSPLLNGLARVVGVLHAGNNKLSFYWEPQANINHMGNENIIAMVVGGLISPAAKMPEFLDEQPLIFLR